MTTQDWRPSPGQIFRAVLRIALDAVTITFARKKAISYASDGQNIHGTIYYPEADSPAPGILLLHTAFGLTPHEHAMAFQLAREGYATLVIAYSTRTTGAILSDDKRRKQLEQIVVDGLRFLQADPKTDANRTAVIGLSLGGYLAIHIATSVEETAPKAVVLYYGAYAVAESQIERLRGSLLILQGENDYEDFVTNAKSMQELALRHEKACELVLYPGAVHQFDLFEASSETTRDAWERTKIFLRRHLGSPLQKKDSETA